MSESQREIASPGERRAAAPVFRPKCQCDLPFPHWAVRSHRCSSVRWNDVQTFVEGVGFLDPFWGSNTRLCVLEDPKALNKRLYKEVPESQLTAVLIITVRNSLGREVNDIAPVETVGNT